MNNKIGWGIRLQQALDIRGWTREKLAGVTHKTVGAVTTWVNESRYPNVKQFWLLCKVLGISADELLFGESKATEPVNTLELVATCKQNDSLNRDELHLLMAQIKEFDAKQANDYLHAVRNLFCVISMDPYKSETRYMLIMLLFYADFFMFALMIASAADSALLRTQINRNLEIGRVFLMLLPSGTCDTCSVQDYVINLLELENYPRIRESIEGLVCTTTLAMFWLANNQKADPVLALYSVGKPMVINLLSHIAGLVSSSLDLNLPDFGIELSSRIHLQSDLRSARNEIKRLISLELVGLENLSA